MEQNKICKKISKDYLDIFFDEIIDLEELSNNSKSIRFILYPISKDSNHYPIFIQSGFGKNKMLNELFIEINKYQSISSFKHWIIEKQITII